MNVQEALARIKEHRDIHFHNEPNAIYITEALDMAIEALEKQIPKKPIPNSHDMFGIKCCICPVCSCHVYSTSNSFCHRCGQALDWSDEK